MALPLISGRLLTFILKYVWWMSVGPYWGWWGKRKEM